MTGAQRYDLGYDNADQLLTAPLKDAATNTLVRQYTYGYDLASNRTSERVGSKTTTSTPNNVNEIVSQTNPARMLSYDANGSLIDEGKDQAYEWDAANRLTAINYTAIGGRTEFTYDGLGRRVKIVELTTGISLTAQPTNTQYTLFSSGTVTLAAGDYTLRFEGLNPNGGDNTVFVDSVKLNGTLVPNGGFEAPSSGSYVYAPAPTVWSYQSNAGVTINGSGFTSGNPNALDGSQVGFIQQTGSASQVLSLAGGAYTLTFYAAQRGNYQLSYQQVRASLQQGTQIAGTKQFVWIGNSIAEERDADNNVTRRFYAEGEQISGSNYYYTRDHLGSVRELTDSSGTIRARYDYDPYGIRTKLSGDLDAEFGYTGHYFHQPSGLNLTLYRAYDPITGRWISRDSLGEAGGLNLYGYVDNNALNATDILGLDGLLVIIRDAGRDSAGTIYLFDNGLYLDSGRVNTNGYYDGTHGVPNGTYYVLPKNNYAPGDRFFPGQPSITDPRYGDPSSPDYAPGRAGPSYDPTVRIHENGRSGSPDSRACVTTDPDTLRKIIDLIMRNLSNGGTTLKIYYNSGVPVAIPYRP